MKNNKITKFKCE